MKFFYDLSKKIVTREIKEISGKEFDKYHAQASEFVDEMKRFLKNK